MNTQHILAVLRDVMQQKDKWLYRAIIMGTVLKSLGYSVDNIIIQPRQRCLKCWQAYMRKLALGG